MTKTDTAVAIIRIGIAINIGLTIYHIAANPYNMTQFKDWYFMRNGSMWVMGGLWFTIVVGCLLVVLA